MDNDYQFAFDNDDIDFIKQNYQYNSFEIIVLLEYCIIKNLPSIFSFYINKDYPTINILKHLPGLINYAITQKNNNTLFLETLLNKYSNIYDLNKPNPNTKSIFEYTHLNLAIYEKKLNAIIILLNHGVRTDVIYPFDDRSSIHIAVLIGHQGILKVLLGYSSKETINFLNKKFESPLHLAVINNDISSVKLLVESGADINQKNKEGYTPLDLSKNTDNNLFLNKFLTEKGAISTFFVI